MFDFMLRLPHDAFTIKRSMISITDIRMENPIQKTRGGIEVDMYF
jgi:hypothetical protein